MMFLMQSMMQLMPVGLTEEGLSACSNNSGLIVLQMDILMIV